MDTGEWLSANIGWILGALAVLATIGAPLTVYLWQRNTKHLDYKVLENVPLLARQTGGIQGQLKVLLGDQEVQDPHIVTIRIKNTGKLAIVESDYDIAPNVEFEENEAVFASVSNSSEDNYVGDPFQYGDPYEHGVTIIYAVKPRLMNPKDWFDFQLLTDGKPGAVRVSARIINQTRPMHDIAKANPFDRHWPRIMLVTGILSGIIALGLTIALGEAIYLIAVVPIYILAAFVAGGIGLAFESRTKI